MINHDRFHARDRHLDDASTTNCSYAVHNDNAYDTIMIIISGGASLLLMAGLTQVICRISKNRKNILMYNLLLPFLTATVAARATVFLQEQMLFALPLIIMIVTHHKTLKNR